MRPDGSPLIELRATVRRSPEKLFAREQSEVRGRLQREAERRLGRRRLGLGVRWEWERQEDERGVTITLRARAE